MPKDARHAGPERAARPERSAQPAPHRTPLRDEREIALSVRNLHVHRGAQEVLGGISFDVARGEVFALLGGNGAGKSTTLLTCLGMLTPTAGEISVLGVSPAADAAAVRGSIAYLPETAALYDHLSALENLDYFLALAGRAPEPERIAAALDLVALQSDARTARMGGFSKGMRQKVAIALALLRETPVLLLDEPTSGLDPIAVGEFNELLGTLRSRGVAILMVTHDLFGACEVASQIALLRGGQLVATFDAQPGGRVDVDAVRDSFAARATARTTAGAAAGALAGETARAAAPATAPAVPRPPSAGGVASAASDRGPVAKPAAAGVEALTKTSPL